MSILGEQGLTEDQCEEFAEVTFLARCCKPKGHDDPALGDACDEEHVSTSPLPLPLAVGEFLEEALSHMEDARAGYEEAAGKARRARRACMILAGMSIALLLVYAGLLLQEVIS